MMDQLLVYRKCKIVKWVCLKASFFFKIEQILHSSYPSCLFCIEKHLQLGCILSVLIIWLFVPSILLLKNQFTSNWIFTLCFCRDYSEVTCCGCKLYELLVQHVFWLASLQLNCPLKLRFNCFQYTEWNQLVFSRYKIWQNIDIYALALHFHACCSSIRYISQKQQFCCTFQQLLREYCRLSSISVCNCN